MIRIGILDDDEFQIDCLRASNTENTITSIPLNDDLINRTVYNDFDLIIFDVDLGEKYEFNGFELAVNAVKYNTRIVIIVCSTVCHESYELNCIHTKPYNMDRIEDTYKKLINNLEENKWCIISRAAEYRIMMENKPCRTTYTVS